MRKMINPEEARQRLWDPATREATILELADFYRDLVLAFGGTLETASAVGHEIVKGLDREWRNVDAIREAAQAQRQEGDPPCP